VTYRAYVRQKVNHILDPSLAELDSALRLRIAARSPLTRARHAFEHALDARIAAPQLTA